MRIELEDLKIENFKGIKYFPFGTNGKDAEIVAENGIGKTSVADAFSWLVADKDTTERKQFELRPLDRNNNPIKGVVVSVTGVLDCNGVIHTLRKENHEKVVKNQIRGYETLCWIDEVPKKVGEYQKWINDNLAPVEILKLLTNLRYFCEDEKKGGIHHTKRREILLEVAGEIGRPEGFEKLLEEIKIYDELKDYKKVLRDQKTRHEKERDEINPRIDELLRGLEHPNIDTTQLESQRAKLQAETAKLRRQRQDLFGRKTEYQTNIDKINQLKKQQAIREGELENDNSALASLYDEKADLDKKIAEARQLVTTAENQKNLTIAKKKAVDNELSVLLSTLEDIRVEYNIIDEEKPNEVCYACGQKLPKNKLVENLIKKQERLDEIEHRGDKAKEQVTEKKKLIEAAEKNIQIYSEELQKAKAELEQVEEQANKRFAEIEKELKNRPKPDLEKDETWQKITAEIDRIEKELGAPVSEQLQAIESVRISKDEELNKINEQLAQADRLKKDAARVKELEAREKELAQLIADIDKKLNEISRYEKAESELITEAVNDKFDVVEFKLFKELLNGGLEPCCEVTFNGVPYSDLSFGQQMYVGLDVVNVLSGHYGISCPLFIDHAESMTMSIESKAQKILLRAQPGVKSLQVNIIEKGKVKGAA